MPERVGVTGAAGFIGSHLVERLVADGCSVVGVDDLSHGALTNLATCNDSPRFEFHQLDCRRRHELRRALRGCDAIVHLAAEKIPRYGGALKTLEANVEGARVTYRAALALGAHVVIASTSDVYGNARPPLAEDQSVTLGPPTTRRWAYAVSKLYDEHLALALAEERGLQATILRLFGSYGPRNHPTWWGGPQAAFIEALLDGRPMEIHGDGRQVRTFTYVADTVEGFVRALYSRAAVGQIVNVGGDEPTTIAMLASQVQEAVGLPGPLRCRHVPYERIGGRYQDVRCRVPDTSKAAELLGFRATVALPEGLAATVGWHRQRRAATVPAAAARGPGRPKPGVSSDPVPSA